MCYHRVPLAGYGCGDGDKLLLMHAPPAHRGRAPLLVHCGCAIAVVTDPAPRGAHLLGRGRAELGRANPELASASCPPLVLSCYDLATSSLSARYQLAMSTLSAHYELANSSLSARSRYRTQRNSYYDRAMLCRPHVVHVQLIVSLL